MTTPKHVSGTVKSLEWHDRLKISENEGFVCSQGGLLSYSIMLGCFRVYGIVGDHDGAAEFPSIEVAKAAAQADYEARILAAIQPDPEPQPVAWACWDLAFGCGAKHITSDRQLVDARLKRPNSWRVEPLYATPSSAGTVSVEAVMREIHRFAAERNWHPGNVTELVATIGNLRALTGNQK